MKPLLLALSLLWCWSVALAQAEVPKQGPVAIECVVGMNQRVALSDFGGPRAYLSVLSVNDLEIVVRKAGMANERIEKKTGLGEARTLLLDDGRGCRVFFVERTQRAANEVILRFEHAENSLSRPATLPPSAKVVP